MSATEVLLENATCKPVKNLDVLVVDDDEDIRWLFSYILSGAGYAVKTACDSRGGLEQIAEKVYDVIVLDYVLPDMKGSQVALEILEMRSDAKIIFVTGYPEFSSELMRIPRLMNQVVLYKPVSAESLLKTIEMVQRLG